jgi:formamidopyrimidine-DNA glycosylase
MPELPEVTTTVNGLQKVLPGLVIVDAWTDLAKENPIKQFKNTVKDATFFKKFKKEIVGQKVVNVERRAKNILINLSSNQTILVHMKMTGHMIWGNYVYDKKKNLWLPHSDEREALHDPYNRFLHVVISFGNEKQLVLCDSRKFAKVTLIDTQTMHQTVHLEGIGPEPLAKDFTFLKFKERLLSKNNAIKTVLMNQEVIAGIGNIYSDEMLWLASIHPESHPAHVPLSQSKLLYTSMLHVLKKGIDFGGDSMSDYRDIDGKPGQFQNQHNVYRKTGEPCSKRSCSGTILRKVINGRSAHFCDTHQKCYN